MNNVIQNPFTGTDCTETAADSAYLHEIYARNIESVYRICFLRLGHREDAEDAAQNIFLRYMKHPTVFSSPEHEKAYFLRAACNECQNQKLAFWHRMRTPLDDLPDYALSSGDRYPSVDNTLPAAFAALPERIRTVVYLYYYEELPTKTIAKLLSRNESTVRTQLQTGREQLRAAIEKTGGCL
ncbi:MAG: sigma-70 family RNA polymerase sigma factor [Clostridia bacterium]|nr:sigma-70 family RNA polymerase sigma factor [Clostridia bacterium]